MHHTVEAVSKHINNTMFHTHVKPKTCIRLTGYEYIYITLTIQLGWYFTIIVLVQVSSTLFTHSWLLGHPLNHGRMELTKQFLDTYNLTNSNKHSQDKFYK